MRLCIPTSDDSGRAATRSEHFGRAPYYTVVDTDTSDVQIVENESDHYGGATQPPVFVANLDVEAVVVEEVGERSMSVFERRGIDVYRASHTDVESLVDAFERGVLPELDADDVHPSGHHHDAE